MRVQYTRNAIDDLSGIIGYLASRNPYGGEKVGADTRAAIDRLAGHPLSGREQDEEDVRRIISPGYRHALYHHVDRQVDPVSVLAIQHPAREQPFRST